MKKILALFLFLTVFNGIPEVFAQSTEKHIVQRIYLHHIDPYLMFILLSGKYSPYPEISTLTNGNSGFGNSGFGGGNNGRGNGFGGSNSGGPSRGG